MLKEGDRIEVKRILSAVTCRVSSECDGELASREDLDGDRY